MSAASRCSRLRSASGMAESMIWRSRRGGDELEEGLGDDHGHEPEE
jgi:hypothetical protein